jgi:hypothetical protein
LVISSSILGINSLKAARKKNQENRKKKARKRGETRRKQVK